MPAAPSILKNADQKSKIKSKRSKIFELKVSLLGLFSELMSFSVHIQTTEWSISSNREVCEAQQAFRQ